MTCMYCGDEAQKNHVCEECEKAGMKLAANHMTIYGSKMSSQNVSKISDSEREIMDNKIT